MKPGDRVTWKYDSIKVSYGTVIEPKWKTKNEKAIFVTWDRYPETFTMYDGEVRLVRKDEEINFPEIREVK